MDPTQWSDREAGELERQMLDAARADRVPEPLRARMAQGLGLKVGSSGALPGGLSTGKAGASLFGSTGLWGSLAVLVVVGTGGYAAWPSESAQHEPAASVPSRPVAPAPGPQPKRVDVGQVPGALGSAAQERGPADAQHEGQAPRPAAVELPDDAALRAEVALLDRARGALQTQDNTRALQLLQEYASRFPRARLGPEAAALRIEALLAQGEADAARGLMQDFMRAHPTHPLQARVARQLARHGAAARQHPLQQ